MLDMPFRWLQRPHMLVLLAALCVQGTPAQNRGTGMSDTSSVFFPLSDGDCWEYLLYEAAIGLADTIRMTVAGDTLAGGHRYKLIRRYSMRYRTASAILRRFDSVGDVHTRFDSTEYLSHRFSDTSSLPWETVGGWYCRWDGSSDEMLFGTWRRKLAAVEYDPPDTDGLFGVSSFYYSGIGLAGTSMHGGSGYAIRGARIGGIQYGTITALEDRMPPEVPGAWELGRNYPNPFNPSTTIRYSVAEAGWVSLAVYDLLGRRVALLVDETKTPGTYAAEWVPADAPSGVYICRMRARSFQAVNTMVFLR